eukprot:Gb_15298 [translate_table: standard]
MVKKLCYIHLFRGRSVVSKSSSFLASRFGSFFSTATTNTCDDTRPLQNGENAFRDFVVRRFNLSSADVAKIFRIAPRLEKLQTLQNVYEFIDFFKKCGCKEEEIGKIMTRHPILLTVNPDRSLEPKVQLLKDFGVAGGDLVKVLTYRPRILSTGLERGLLPRIAFLLDVFQTKEFLAKALVRTPSLLTYDLDKKLKPSLAIWEDSGIFGEELAALLLTRPSLLVRSSLTPAKIDYMQKLGVPKGTKRYKHVLTVVAVSRMETLEDKLQNLVRLGLTSEEARLLFRTSPYIFVFSKEKVQRNMDFIVNTMELPANIVVKRPYLLQLNLERTLIPRFLVLEKIKTLSELPDHKMTSIRTILKMPESTFVEKIVKGHPQSAVLSQIYEMALANASRLAKISSKAFTF